MIIGIAGRVGRDGQGTAGAGKGETAKCLVDRFGFVRVAFADEIKRTVRRWWPNFTIEELWGPSECRSRVHDEYGELTARRACQYIGTEIGRNLDPDVWVRYGLYIARSLLRGNCYYSSPDGLIPSLSARRPEGVVFDDMRFPNEIDGVRGAGGKTLLVIREDHTGLKGEAGAHASESALNMDTSMYHAVVYNKGTLADLHNEVQRTAQLVFRLSPLSLWRNRC